MNGNFLKIILVISYSSSTQAIFEDKIDGSGIDFVHFNGMTGEFYFHEMMGAGTALFDFDNDGDLDVYLCQGNVIEKGKKTIFDPGSSMPLIDKLYRNDSVGGQLRFVDVTKKAQINAAGYGMGVSIADIDNDGDKDIYLSNYGDNQMWLNNGDGTFKDVSKASGTADKGWSIAATFIDYDKDGFLDLYVVNYVDYDISSPVRCKSYDGALDYCSPQGFKATSDTLYHNNKNGTFSNVSSRSGIMLFKEPALGVVAADFNRDGWVDMYVANDGKPNTLWINTQRGGFVNKAMVSGVAVNMTGVAEASMGVDAADFDNDGDVDLFMTHLNRQTNTLYVNNGNGWFSDSGVRMGVGSSSFKSTGFGTGWFDFDNDGLLDLFSANGAVIKEPKQVENKEKFPLKQVNQLWHNQGNNVYKEVTKEQGRLFLRPSVSRAAAFGDIDNDGDTDILVTNNSDRPHLLINESINQNNWIGFVLKNPSLNREDYGAKVEVKLKDKTIIKQLKADGSYASSHDSRILIGLGQQKQKPSVKIIWSDGSVQPVTSIKLNTYQIIEKVQ